MGENGSIDIYSRSMSSLTLYLEDEQKRDLNQDRDFVEKLLSLAENPNFMISSSAYKILYHLLIHGKQKCVKSYLKDNSQRIFKRINELIQSKHFVVQKQFIVLLRDLLTYKGRNHDVMKQYVSKKDNLAIIMNLMKKHKENSLSFEAYHIFKIFIANPEKEKKVHIVLWKNKKALLRLLSGFHDEKARDNELFAIERSTVIQYVQNIPSPKELEQKNRKRTH